MFPPAAGCRKNRSGYRKIPRIHGPVVQLVRTLACHARGQGFESPSGRHLEKTALAVYASVAQLVEQGTENPRVVGSIPTGGTIYADLAHLVERNLAKVEVAGSSPVIRSTKKQHPHGCCFLNKIIRRHGQVVRHRSAKPLSPGSNPGGASNKRRTFVYRQRCVF